MYIRIIDRLVIKIKDGYKLELQVCQTFSQQAKITVWPFS